MKFAIPVIATLALVAANPVRRQDSGVPGLVFKGDKAELPSCCEFHKRAGNVLTPASGCDDGWDCFHSNGQDLCCPPGMECDGESSAVCDITCIKGHH